MEGDIHTKVMQAIRFDAGVDDPEVIKRVCRHNTKTLEYAMVYGGGNAKLGSIAALNCSMTGTIFHKDIWGAKRQDLASIGLAVRNLVSQGISGLDQVVARIQAEHKATQRITGMDGRPLRPRGEHSAFNLYVQNFGAVIAKRATLIMLDKLRAGVGRDGWQFIFFNHDEWQFLVRKDPALIEAVQEAILYGAREAGEYYNLNIPIDATVKTGQTWKDTH
jgi:DNA polymerase I-like protein with 3'-5' exonuclease and polymerase domains